MRPHKLDPRTTRLCNVTGVCKHKWTHQISTCVSEIAPLVKVPASKPDGLSLTLGTHLTEEENYLSQVIL